jgi:glutamate-1-semialdehyde 2,1-aminomutase
LRLIGEPGFFDRLGDVTRRLVDGLTAEAGAAGVEFSADHVGGMFGVFFRSTPPRTFPEVMTCDKERFNRFFHLMLDQGIYLAPSAFEAGFVSAAHADEELSLTVAAARRAFSALAA